MRVCRSREQEYPRARGGTWRPLGGWMLPGHLVAHHNESPGTPDPHLLPRGFLSWGQRRPGQGTARVLIGGGVPCRDCPTPAPGSPGSLQ